MCYFLQIVYLQINSVILIWFKWIYATLLKRVMKMYDGHVVNGTEASISSSICFPLGMLKKGAFCFEANISMCAFSILYHSITH